MPKTYGEGGYWTDFDWDEAARLGAEANGLAYSGEYDFAPTDMYWPITHMVAPKEQALQCDNCHVEDGEGVLDWRALGYEGDPMFYGGRADRLMATQSAADSEGGATDDLASRLASSRQLACRCSCASCWRRGWVWPAALSPIPRPCTPPSPCSTQDGVNVLESGEPVSTMQTCGACHDTDYIESHSYHASVGLDHSGRAGPGAGGRPWDMSRGLFGRGIPSSIAISRPSRRCAVRPGNARLDSSCSARGTWAAGPAMRSRDGTPLTELDADAAAIPRPAATIRPPAQDDGLGLEASRARWR